MVECLARVLEDGSLDKSDIFVVVNCSKCGDRFIVRRGDDEEAQEFVCHNCIDLPPPPL